MRRRPPLLAFAALALAAACSDSYNSSMGGGNPPGPTQVFMQGSAFTPVTRTVSTGATVTWQNQDGIVHNVTSSSGPAAFSSGSVGASGTFAQTFTVAGTYEYYCTIHGAPGSGMHGTVVVQ